MSIRSTILGIAGALAVTAALGGVAKAGDEMPEGGPGQSKSVDKGGLGQDRPGAATDRDGKMMRAQEQRGGREAPFDPRAEGRAGRTDSERPDPGSGSPFSRGY